MGCFNILGFYSKMPIKYDDDIVLFICAGYKGARPDILTLDTTNGIYPVALPIFGKYDEYGGIKDIERDENTAYIEETYKVNMSTLIRSIKESAFISMKELADATKNVRYPGKFVFYKTTYDFIKSMQTPAYERFRTPTSIYVKDNMYLTYCIEHKSVYDLIASKNLFTEYREKYESISKLINSLNLKLNIITESDDIMLNDNVAHLRKEIKNGNAEYINKYQSIYNELNNLECLDINSYLTHGLAYDLLTYKNNTYINPENIKETIFCFIDFCTILGRLGGYFCNNAYGSQSINEMKEVFSELNNEYNRIISNLEKTS